MNYATILKATAPLEPEVETALAEYFADFAEPKMNESGDMVCLKCGTRLSGFFGSFKWDIAHGEGICGECGWPCRAHHFIKDAKGEDIATIRNCVLQYDPSVVSSSVASANGAA